MSEQSAMDQILLDRAEAVQHARFHSVPPDSQPMAELFRIGVRWLARDIAANPADYDIPAAPDAVGLPNKVAPVELLVKEINMPSMPQVVIELQNVINAPNSTAEAVAGVVGMDVGLSTFLLRLVNSAFYGFPSQIDTLSRAVAVVGTRQLSALALGTSVIRVFSDLPGITHIAWFWKHSLCTAVIAQEISRRAGLPAPERAFVAGLLHDIGRLALFTNFPQIAEAVMAVHRLRKLPMVEAEQEILSFNHARLGAMLVRKWNFPVSLATAVLHHHSPWDDEEHAETAAVHVANTIAKSIGHGASRDYYVTPVDPSAWSSLGLDAADLDGMLEELRPKIEDMFAILLPQSG